MKINVLIPCAGEGKRCNLSYNKLFYDIGSFPLIVKTINAFIREDINSITLICSEQDFSTFKKIIENINANIKLVLGGDTRQKSVHNGLLSLDKDTDYVKPTEPTTTTTNKDDSTTSKQTGTTENKDTGVEDYFINLGVIGVSVTVVLYILDKKNSFKKI